MKYEKTNVLLNLDLARAKRDLKAKAKKAWRGVYQADITDDGQVLQLHFDIGEMVSLPVQDLLEAYMLSVGIKGDK